MEVFGDLLFVEEGVVATAHGLDRDRFDFEVDARVLRMETEEFGRDFARLTLKYDMVAHASDER
jgi:hypothetical protein